MTPYAGLRASRLDEFAFVSFRGVGIFGCVDVDFNAAEHRAAVLAPILPGLIDPERKWTGMSAVAPLGYARAPRQGFGIGQTCAEIDSPSILSKTAHSEPAVAMLSDVGIELERMTAPGPSRQFVATQRSLSAKRTCQRAALCRAGFMRTRLVLRDRRPALDGLIGQCLANLADAAGEQDNRPVHLGRLREWRADHQPLQRIAVGVRARM